VAFLLAESVEKRTAVFEQMGELYAARSDVVHGTIIPVPRANELRHSAVTLAVECLRRLFAGEERLIKNASRGKAVILRGPSPG
jgi:hypothetical protein